VLERFGSCTERTRVTGFGIDRPIRLRLVTIMEGKLAFPATVAIIAFICINAASATPGSLPEDVPASLLHSSGPRRLSVLNGTEGFRMGTNDTLLPYAEDLGANIPILAMEGETVVLRVWSTTPAVVDDIVTTLSVEILAATNSSQLGNASVVPTTRYISSYASQILAD